MPSPFLVPAAEPATDAVAPACSCLTLSIERLLPHALLAGFCDHAVEARRPPKLAEPSRTRGVGACSASGRKWGRRRRARARSSARRSANEMPRRSRAASRTVKVKEHDRSPDLLR